MASTRGCTAEVRKGRLAKAVGFLQAADALVLIDDAGPLGDAVVTLYVHAGLAAADVICCARLGKHSIGDKHADAISLLRAASPPAARRLATLLKVKTKAGYSHSSASAAEVKKAARAASQLVDEARPLS